MRQFLLARGKATDTVANMTEGQIGVFYLKEGAETLTSDGTGFKAANIVVFRTAENGGPIVIPVHTNNFSMVKGEYQAAVKYESSFKVPAPQIAGDYSIVIALKGKKFNERNKWTASIHVTSKKAGVMTATTLAKQLTELINANAHNHLLKATVSDDTIKFEGPDGNQGYAVYGAEELFGVNATVTKEATPAYGDAAYVTDLANKAAADAGIEYTYRDAYTYLYPNYPLDPLAATKEEDKGFTIFTIRFAEPRDVKTRDEVVNQIVQIACPTGDDAIAYLDAVFAGMAG